eukprot:m.230960 g.230960  ORF g.230960 m.230960 type:complete len:482 (+) comp33591_c2_seq1:205-1650(+)
MSSTVQSRRKMHPKPIFDSDMMIAACDEAGIKREHVYKMWRSLIHGNATKVSDIKDLPKALYELAATDFQVTTSEVVSVSNSDDQSTTKMLIKLQGGNLIEAVIMRYGSVQFSSYMEEMDMKETGKKSPASENAFKSKPRATLCISSQVGCAMGCTFCATGTMGLMANLCSGEILEQLYHANKVEKIRNIVFMGMGEPLDNYNAVYKSIQGMVDVRRWSLKYSQVSVSTVGVVPRLRQLAKDIPKINLALSLHAPTQEVRAEIVPSSKAWHIDDIMKALDFFVAEQNNAVTVPKTVLIEYVLIDNINDSDEIAHQLGDLLAERQVVLNVIPYNVTDVPHDYKSPSVAKSDRFVALVREHGVKTIQRQKLGDDIAGACGQLVVRTIGKETSGCSDKASNDAQDLEDMFSLPSKSSSSSEPRGTGVRIRKTKGDSKPSEALIPSKTTVEVKSAQKSNSATYAAVCVVVCAFVYLVLRYGLHVV